MYERRFINGTYNQHNNRLRLAKTIAAASFVRKKKREWNKKNSTFFDRIRRKRCTSLKQVFGFSLLCSCCCWCCPLWLLHSPAGMYLLEVTQKLEKAMPRSVGAGTADDQLGNTRGTFCKSFTHELISS